MTTPPGIRPIDPDEEAARLARRIEAPDMTPEQYNEVIAETWDRERPGWRTGPT